MTSFVYTFIDYSGEKSTLTIPVTQITNDGLNYVAIAVTEFAAVKVLVDALSIGIIQNGRVVARQENYSSAIPSDEYAQREIGLRFYYTTDGPLQKRGNFTIPAGNLGLALTNQSDEVDLTGTEVAALVSWLESFMEVVGEQVTITRGRAVGRNN